MQHSAEGRRILVVEDEMLVAMLLEDMLEELGHRVVGPVATLAAALEAAAAGGFDAALLDIHLGGNDVYPAAEALAANGVPFAFVTGYQRAGIAAPWADRPVLEKPFRRAKLERLLKALPGAA